MGDWIGLALRRELMHSYRSLAAAAGWGAVMLLAVMVEAQAQAPPPTPAATDAVRTDPGALARELAGRVRELGDALAADVGKTPTGAVLVQDARELGLTVDEFYRALPGAPDPLRRRQLYSGVDSGWHHLRGQLGRAGALAPPVEAAARRVAEADMQLHTALGLNPYPAVYYGDRASPGGMREVQRLARTLVDRAEALLAIVRADVRGASGSRLAEEVTSIVQAADAFHDGVDLSAQVDDLARSGFAGVATASDTVAADLARIQPGDRVRAAWRSYRTTETLLRQTLKLPVRDRDVNPSPLPVEGRSSVAGLADRLITQLDDFLFVFTREARYVAEGGYFIADARRLHGAATEFREVIPRAIDVGQLAYAFRDVDALWQVLARRTNRIAAGPGSNVQRIEAVGQTVAEIHTLLGMPGVPAVVGPFGG
jgi:hypothetical protein